MSATYNLAAGKYVLLCNICDEDEQESHYQMGMRIAFTVNETRPLANGLAHPGGPALVSLIRRSM